MSGTPASAQAEASIAGPVTFGRRREFRLRSARSIEV